MKIITKAFTFILALALMINTFVFPVSAAVALAIGGQTTAFRPEEKEAETLFMAKKAYEDGFYEVSLGMLGRFQNDFPHSTKAPAARLLTGQCYFFQGHYLQALNILESLLNEPAPNNFKDAVYFWIAEVHFKGNNFEKAAAFYEKMINDFPQSPYAPAAYYSLGWSISEIGKYAQALEVFQILQEKFPKEPQSKDAGFKIIECLYNLKKYSELRNKVNPYFKLYANDSLRLSYLYFYLAESEYYLNNFEDAANNYLKSSQVTADDKVRALAKLGLAWANLKLKKYKEAEDAFADIKQSNLDKKSMDILLLGRGVLMSRSNRVYESKKIYGQLISESSDPLILAQAYLGKADALYNLAEYVQAAKVYKEGLDKIDKDSAPAELLDKLRYNLGLAYIKQGQLKAAIEELNVVARSSQDEEVKVGAFSQVGDAYQESGEFAKAEEVYANILKDYPNSPYADYAQYQLGLAQLKKGDLTTAISTFKLMLKNYARSSLFGNAVYSLGLVYFQKGDYLAGCDIFSRFKNELKDSPLASQALYMLGTSFLNLNKPDEALKVFKSIPKLYPQDTELLQKTEYEIADCYYKLGQEKEAIARFKLLRAKYPDSKLTPEIMWWLGQYYYQHDDLNLARRYFNSLSKDFPDSNLTGDAFYALGLTFSDEGKPEQAADNFRMAIKLGPAQLRAQATAALAESYYKIQDYEQAKLFYQKSLELANVSEVADLQFSLAEVLEAKGEFDAAIGLYLKVSDLYPDAPQLFVRALLRAAKIYEDKEEFIEALKLYKQIVEKQTEEAKFAQERIDWISANVKK